MSAFAVRLTQRPWLTVLLAALLYGGLHLLWYWQTPLGISPVLDERENLGLARQIAEGTLPPEPFYRAMGYPLLLSVFPAMGIPEDLQPMAATGLGLLLHGLNSALVALLACRLFHSSRAALVGGLLHALNPVLIHYATQILDGTLANTAFLFALLHLFPRETERRADDAPGAAVTSSFRPLAVSAALCGLGFALAALIRPQFLVLLPFFPLVWLLARPLPWRLQFRALSYGVLAAVGPWVLQGLVQQQIGGSFRLLPTQGAYGVWVANSPGADGRYFTQQVHLPASADHQNPAHYESLVLFERETGRRPASMDEVNEHWRARFWQSLRDDPFAWIGLQLRKCYHLLNHFDAYNNKTYAFHQDRSPWLFWNPLGWGVLLVAGSVGLAALVCARARLAGALILLSSVVAGGIVLTLVSGRFRLPLAAVLCVLCGGLARLVWIPGGRRLLVGGVALAAAFVSFSRFAEAHDTRTFIQDHLLLAASASETGDDVIAWEQAGEALALNPVHPDALAWRLTSGYNLLFVNGLAPEEERLWREAASTFLKNPGPSQPPAALFAISGLAWWRNGQTDAALTLWRQRWETHRETPSWAVLCLAGQTPASGSAPAPGRDSFSVMLAAQQTSNPTESQLRLREVGRRLFERAP